RKVQILQAIKLARHALSADRVIEAAKDADGAVATAAKDTAAAMKIDTNPKPKGPAIGTLKVEDVLAEVVKSKGDKTIGEQVFVKLACNKCHTTKADQVQIGPFLGNVAATYKRRELAEAVLVPSKSIAQGFATNVLELTDGRVLSLFIVKEGADEVIGRNTEGKEFKIPTADIDSRTTTTTSLMPEGLLKDTTVAEFTSLVDYLESLAVKKKD
ncbi:MAG TPA: heme-binding protein, partial [Pirellulales bacterium]